MRSRNLKSLILLNVLITACSSKSSTDRLTEELKTVTSWVATSQMVGEAWLRKDIPTVYAERTLESAKDNLQQETEAITEVAPTQQQKPLRHRIEQLQQSISQMATAVEQHDNPTVVKQLQALSTQKKSLQSLLDTLGTSP